MPKFVLAILAMLTLAACNTLQGAGQDVSAAGDALTDEATEAERGM
jgi:predicted small secreted protein